MRLLLGAHNVTREQEDGRIECKALKTVAHSGYDGKTKHDIMLIQHKCPPVRDLFKVNGGCAG